MTDVQEQIETAQMQAVPEQPIPDRQVAKAEKKPIMAGNSVMAIVPNSAEDVFRLAQLIYNSRLAPKGYDTPEAAWPLPDLIFPTTALRILAAALEAQPNGQTAIRAEITDQDKDKPYVKRLHFAGDGWELTCKTIDGTYPDYTRVMPPLADDITATISYAALKRFPTTACDRALKIDPEAGLMSLRMLDQDGDFAVPVQGKGKAFGVNIHYLKDFARPAGIIRLQSGNPGDPFRCLTEDPNLQQIVMPMRV